MSDTSDFGLASAVDSHSTLWDIPRPTKNEHLAVISHQSSVECLSPCATEPGGGDDVGPRATRVVLQAARPVGGPQLQR